ncbi:MAG: YceI family protein [Sphingobacteriales bacterium]|jgi:polyisoprenoid-binding protein YceI|nr:YceI family protein [Sphingobacteriales bacterium]
MKRITLSLLALALVATSFAKGSKKSESFKVDASKSSVNWLAKKVTGQHNGTITISNGTLALANDKIVGGKFEIDMTSIVNADLQGEWNTKLIGHLKSDDFFSVAKNPTAKLDITKVETKENNTIVNGKLTIKGITQDISFPASVSKKGNVVVAIATIRIDRTKYDIKYGSKSFIEGIGDKAIDDEFELQVNLVAIK